jgi:phage terminase large subunit-like protein
MSTTKRLSHDDVPSPERTLGWSILQWTAEYLQQPDGPHAGDPWTFTSEQVRIALRWYAVDAKGRFAYRRGVLRRMKGWGKDPFLAAMAAAELCGPCRFGGWDARGEPVAIQHPAPWVQVAAASLDQTRNTMTLFSGLFSSAAIDEYKVDLGKTIIYVGRGGQIEAVTSSPRSLEGKRTSLTILNESQEWIASNDGHAMAAAIRRNLAKSNDGAARSMEICNAHLPGEGSVAEKTYEVWRKAGGKIPGLYYDSLESPEIKDLGDREALTKALIVARGDSTWLNVERLADEIADPITPEHISRRYYLNQIVAVGAERWMDMEKWDACAREGQEIANGDDVVVGFDGSFDEDATAVVAVSVGETPHVQVVRCWERPEGSRGWRVPIEDVEEEMRAACKRWRVGELTSDPYRWARSLEVLANERVAGEVTEFPQRPGRMIPATTRFYEAVVNGAMTHDGDPVLRRHVSNAMLKVNSQGGHLSKDAKSSPRKIDAAVAAVMAFDRAAQYQVAKPEVIDMAEVLAEMRAEGEEI